MIGERVNLPFPTPSNETLRVTKCVTFRWDDVTVLLVVTADAVTVAVTDELLRHAVTSVTQEVAWDAVLGLGIFRKEKTHKH